MTNKYLHAAKVNKNDEFYTLLSDIEKELQHYKQHFKDKVVYCNCDDPNASNFFCYFFDNFKHLGLKKLIASGYKTENTDRGVRAEYLGEGNAVIEPLKGDGDFRSDECVELLKQADIVVTNPPFSLFQEYVAQLAKYNKKFLIIGNQNAFAYNGIFQLLRDNKVWVGANKNDMEFLVPGYYEPKATRYRQDEQGRKWRSLGNVSWFTNLDHDKRPEKLVLQQSYSPEAYPKYDNYDAIEVSKVANIPHDYVGVMGVPITFFLKHNPDRFEVIGCSNNHGRPKGWAEDTDMAVTINGKEIYKRILIKHKR